MIDQEIAESPMLDSLHLQLLIHGQIPYTARRASRHHYPCIWKFLIVLNLRYG